MTSPHHPFEPHVDVQEDGQVDAMRAGPFDLSVGAPRAVSKPGGVAQQRFKPGDTIADRFKVVRFIARGGMGEVYEVEDRFLQGARVALKVILPQVAEDAESARRFEREVLLARKVIHRNLCPIYDLSRCPTPPPPFVFLTMKLLSGETLSARLRRTGGLTGSEALSVFRQLCSGLAALHAGGVIHRDIKPNNVMLDGADADLCVSIMDFGLARLHESQTTANTRGMVAGTPGYLAPELLEGHPPSQESDLYALGVLLYQMVTGERPVCGVHGASAKTLSTLERVHPPPPLAVAVRALLANDPARRHTAFQEVVAKLESNRVEDQRAGFLLTRRHFAEGSAAAVCVAVAAAVWQREWLKERMHPLPQKRFVALLGWLPPETRLEPMLNGVIDAMAAELSRAEAMDHDLLVMAQQTLSWVTTPQQMNEAQAALGANLVLAASTVMEGSNLLLMLNVFDQVGAPALRHTRIKVPADAQATLPERATQAAAKLLSISRYRPRDQRVRAGTTNAEAYAAFQAAEVLRKQDNDTGLEDAIAKYKQALELDPRYAEAQAQLGWAYLRLYAVTGDAAALTLARGNAVSASTLDPTSVDAHLTMACADVQTGDYERAAAEMTRTLALDPANAHTLSYQGDLEARTGRYAESEATFARALRLRPNYWLAHQELGVAYNQQGKYAQALMEFRSASLLAPKNALAAANVGSVYRAMGQLGKAADALQASLRMKPNGGAALDLAETSRIQGNYPAAIAYAQQATRLDPSDAANWLELGDCYAAQPRSGAASLSAYRRAAQTAEEHLQTEKKDGPGWMLLALCRTKVGELRTVPMLVARAESLFAVDVGSQILKVRILELLGHRDEALATMAQCLRRGPTGFQFQTMPNLQRLRNDVRYRQISDASASTPESG